MFAEKCNAGDALLDGREWMKNIYLSSAGRAMKNAMLVGWGVRVVRGAL